VEAPLNPINKAQSEDRLLRRKLYGSVPLWEDFTRRRNAETLRLVNHKPEAPECMRGLSRPENPLGADEMFLE